MSKLNFKDPAASALVNNAFLGRTTDDTATGIINLESVEVLSGDNITNIQRQLNENKLKINPNQDVTALGQFVGDNISRFQILRVQGDSAAVEVSGTPFGASPDLQDGTILYIIGQSDTNTVTINHNDVDDGCILNGNAVLSKGYCLTLFWDANIKRFIDLTGRNF